MEVGRRGFRAAQPGRDDLASAAYGSRHANRGRSAARALCLDLGCGGAGAARHMIRAAMVALLVGLGVYALIAGYMFFNQRQLLYHPDIKQVDPATLGITGAEVTAVATPDGEKLVAWYAPAPAGRPTVLFLHGNAGSIAERPLRFQYYRKAGFGVLYLSWRGYGG